MKTKQILALSIAVVVSLSLMVGCTKKPAGGTSSGVTSEIASGITSGTSEIASGITSGTSEIASGITSGTSEIASGITSSAK